MLPLLAVSDHIPSFLFRQRVIFQAPVVSVELNSHGSFSPGLFLHQVVWGSFMGAANRRDSLQGCGLLSHHLGSGQ